ncbi:MAG: AbrB/MazE/SpoVT family DNA-binding domain-containing protein [Gammaproteobacteria bacterium]|jgi:AbrB family looped-hinge helix DNA binding protein|uniref:AbrB/MazE/SpoVT family DNA-binding domain-containing protein n=1 Tax=Acidiferrobacter sp. SPIII_3 TaxID=1281578 RepID=UPI000D73C888|nr:AbrB/MazE/SpoVT family DNA-binding domain-containing protein [Acidiferrobacter sp. SPIII_3]AWP24797.1 AbrB family transcriptional regulator [Acidiferrobacter sp. SPIII_3]MDA8118582.1 AbrB/MazE/SpoVT family DNA-binding domain-containing protein [Gammaproteobacteria bacterium]
MTAVTVSEKYQIVVPEARAALGTRPGQSLRVLVYEGRVELLPERYPRDARLPRAS